MTEQPKRGRGRPPRAAAVEAQVLNNIYENIYRPQNGVGRDFLCQLCGKSYLSSPALYLHMKTKHVQAESRQLNGEYKRGRGRPKRADGANGTPLNGSSRVDPTGDLFMRMDERRGGPTDPMSGFESNVNTLFFGKYSDYTQHPLFEHIARYSFKNTPQGPDDTMNGLKKNVKDVDMEIQNFREDWKNFQNCEGIFAIYLRTFSKCTNENYYSTLTKFVLMFRDCLNQYGWQKKAENEEKDMKEPQYQSLSYEDRVQAKLQEYDNLRKFNEFTAINNCEYAPEIANEFVTVYMEDERNNKGGLDRTEIIDLTQHLCNWLFTQKLTCSKLSMVS
eukprot:403337381